jgi:acyl-CoA thioester hydrolase
MRGYKVVTPIQVRFRDLDAMRHVNAPVYFTYLEAGRLALFSRIRGKDLKLEEIDFIVARLEGDFLGSVRLGDEVLLGTKVVSTGRTSIVVEQLLTANGKPCFKAKEVLVFYDFGKNEKKPVTGDVAEAAKMFMAEEE